MASITLPRPRVDEDEALELHRARNEAFFEGRAAGLGGIAFALNPYSDGIGCAEWSRGWYAGHAQRSEDQAKRTERARALAAELRERAKKCTYTHAPCDCEGRGLCLDVC